MRTTKIACLALASIPTLAGLPAAAADLAPVESRPAACSWTAPGTSVQQQVVFEPSGLAWNGKDKIFAVGDNGVIARRSSDAGKPEWECLYVWSGDSEKDLQGKNENDFESVAFNPATPVYLYIGVEGNRFDPHKGGVDMAPHLRRFDLGTKSLGSTWYLAGKEPDAELRQLCYAHGSGVESITFMPDSSTQGGMGGYFLASSQTKCEPTGTGALATVHAGEVYAYDLPANPTTAVAYRGKRFALPQGHGKNSDFYFAADSCALYVSYDDESHATEMVGEVLQRTANGKQSVSIYTLNEGRFPTELAKSEPVPFQHASNNPLPHSRGVEGVTAVTRSADQVDLVVAIDMSEGQNPGTLQAGEKRTVKPADPKKGITKDDIKAAKGQAPEAVDRYSPFARTQTPFCPCRAIRGCHQLGTIATGAATCGWCADSDKKGPWLGSAQGPVNGTCSTWTIVPEGCR